MHCCCSFAKSCLTLPPQGLQHTSLSCPSPSPRVCSNSHSLSQWFNLAISSSAVLFYFCLQSFPASESFQISWLFTSGGQTIGASVSATILPMNIQGWFPLGLTSVISLQSEGPSRVFSSTTARKHQFFGTQPSLWSNSHMTIWTFVGKVMSLLLIHRLGWS